MPNARAATNRKLTDWNISVKNVSRTACDKANTVRNRTAFRLRCIRYRVEGSDKLPPDSCLMTLAKYNDRRIS